MKNQILFRIPKYTSRDNTDVENKYPRIKRLIKKGRENLIMNTAALACDKREAFYLSAK